MLAAQAPKLVVTFTTPLLGDETAPQVVFTAPPALTTDTSPPVSLSFSDDQSGVDAASFALTLDGVDVTADCTVTAAGADCTTSALTEASHALSATLADLAGNVATADFTFQVTSDVTPPSLAVTAPTGTVVDDTTPAVTVTFSDAESGIATATLLVAVDGFDITGSCVLGSGTATCEPPALKEGQHTVTAQVADLAGNVTTASGSFTLDLNLTDTVPPSLAVTAPAAPVTDDPAPAITVTYSDADSDVDLTTLDVAVDGFSLVAAGRCAVGATSASCTPPLLGSGTHAVTATITDLAGNPATATASFDLSYTTPEATAPMVAITEPAQTTVFDDFTPQITVEYSDADVAGSLTGVAILTLAVDVDGTDITAGCVVADASAVCEPPPLTVGTHVVTATVEDLHGNVGTASFGFDIAQTTPDTTAPAIAITEPSTTPVTTDTVPIRVTYADAETGVDLASLAIRLDAADITSSCDVGATEATCTSPVLAEGSHTVDATVQDLAGNPASDSFTFDVVTGVSPVLSFVEPGSVVVDDSTPSILVQYSDPNSDLDISTFQLSLDGSDITGTCSISSSQAACESPSIAAGNHTLSAQITDLAGHTGTQSQVFEIQFSDLTPPSVAVTEPGPLVENDPTPQIVVTYSDTESGVDPNTLEILLDGLSILSACSIGPGSATCEAPVLSEGTHRLQVTVEDQVGNGGRADFSFEVTLDQDPPLLSIASPSEAILINVTAPQVVLEYSDAETGVDLSSLSVAIDGLDITGSCTVGPTSASCSSPDVGEGAHTVTAEISDLLGNLALSTFTFTSVVDVTAPQLLVVTPADGSTVDDTTPTISLSYIDDGIGSRPETLTVSVDGTDIVSVCLVESTMAQCEAPALSEGAHALSATIEDLAGNLASVSTTFTATLADLRAPTLTVITPIGPEIVGDASPEIRADYSDEGSGIDLATFLATLDGTDITSGCDIQATEAVCEPPILSEGFHVLEVEIQDVRGNRSTHKVSFDLVLMLPIAITAPSSGTLTQDSTITVTGTVAPEATEVVIASIAADLTNGSFSASIPLREGVNTLTAVARTPDGGIGSAPVIVVRDTTAPTVVIEAPPPGFVTTASQILVTGEVNEPASSGASFLDPTVTVNGVPIAVQHRAFVAEDFLLQPGDNEIRVEATDAAGNVGVAEVKVTLLADPVQKIEELLGNGQTGTVGQALPNPIIVRVTDGVGNPLSERLVSFEVTRGDGTVKAGTEEGRSLTVRTDDLGRAQVDFILGERSGMGNHEVTVTSVGFPGSLAFCASAMPLPANRIVRIQGNRQTGVLAGAVGEQLPKPLFSQVFDAMDNPVSGVPVTFEVVTGDGSFGGNPTLTINTDANGVATALFTLGPVAGIDVNVVKASIPGAPTSPAVFNVTGLEPGPESQTSVSGIVLDNQDQPVPNVTMSIEHTLLSTLTDAEGRFQLAGAPVGTIHLKADGTTATLPGNWAVLMFEMVTVSGQDNELGNPVRLLPINPGVMAGGDEDVEIPLPGVPGASLTVFAHSATFPDGSKEGLVSFTQVHNDKVPMVPPLGSTFAVALTIQPTGTLFEPPAQIQIPNPGHKPGEVVDIFGFDHDLGEFVPEGTGTVTPDGQFLRSNPGSGVHKAGWHGCARPVPETDVCGPGDVGVCTVCTESGPIPRCDDCSVCTGDSASPCEPKMIEAATIDAQPKITTEGEVVTLTAGSTDNCGDKEYVWSFGDGSDTETTEDSTTTHMYQDPGKYSVGVTVKCKKCGTASKASAPMDVRVVGVDLQLDGLPEEDEPAPNELTPGAFLGVPEDPAQAQLIPLSINFQGFGADTGDLELTVGPGSGKVLVWQDSGRTSQVPLPMTWSISGSDITESYFVEAVQPSDTAQEIEFHLQYTNSETTAEDLATLTTFEVKWVKPAENDVVAEGTEVRWVARAKPSTVSGQQFTWSFSFTAGTANPLTGAGEDAGAERRFDSTATASGPLTAKVELTLAGRSSTAERSIEVVRPEVVDISFVNDIALRHWEPGDAGYDIQDPVWKRSLGGSVTKNEPIAYVRSTTMDSIATAELKLDASKSLSESTVLRIRGTGQGTPPLSFDFIEVPVQDWSAPGGQLSLDSTPLLSTNDVYDPLQIRWEYVVKKQDGTFPPWSEGVELGMSDHVLYTTFASPALGGARVFDLALEKSCKVYARGLDDEGAIATAMTSGIDGDLCYDPGAYVAGYPLNAYAKLACQCTHNADLLVVLARSVGIVATSKIFYGGDSVGTVQFFRFDVGGRGKASAQFDTPQHDAAVEDAHFTFHVQTLINGTYYDPSYGSVGKVTTIHLCTSGMTLLESDQPWSSQVDCGVIDPHVDSSKPRNSCP